MGDPHRFDITAKFIATNFPPPRRVADVAGGRGEGRGNVGAGSCIL